MKISRIVICSLFLLGLTIAADVQAKEKTYMGSLKAKETKTITVELDKGKSEIDAFPEDEQSKINCQFIDLDGSVLLDLKNVNICAGKTTLDLPWPLKVKLTNTENKEINFRIEVHGSS